MLVDENKRKPKIRGKSTFIYVFFFSTFVAFYYTINEKKKQVFPRNLSGHVGAHNIYWGVATAFYLTFHDDHKSIKIHRVFNKQS